jgi:cysteine desulfurase family protein (TIGR01976 family)
MLLNFPVRHGGYAIRSRRLRFAAMTIAPSLDLEFVRSQFPAFASAGNADASFFESAAGSFACRQTIDALMAFYTDTKVQPYSTYGPSKIAGEQMDRARTRWADALGVEANEVTFGPSTSMNTYVLAHAFGQLLEPGDEVIVTNQDHEANTGSTRRMAERAGCIVREWTIDEVTGLLDIDVFESLVTDRTRLVTVPHASNIVGKENDVARICELAHRVGARVIVDGVSFAPHTIPDVAALGADVYLFSMYKTYSVHQGLMVVRRGLLDELPNQNHFFNDRVSDKLLNPAGPDHAQVACAGAVLDFIQAVHTHHGGEETASLRQACSDVSGLWRHHEDSLTPSLLAAVDGNERLRLLGPATLDATPGHRCPTVAFSPLSMEPRALLHELSHRGVQTSAGHFYAWRVLDGLGVDPERGVVRLSFVHYTSADDIDRAIMALDEVVR